MQRPVTRAEMVDVCHELSHGIAVQSFRPGTSLALIQSASCIALVTPFQFETATERLAVASAGPLLDLRIAGVIKSNSMPPDEVLSALIDYMNASDTGEDGSDAQLFNATMGALCDDLDTGDEPHGQVLDAIAVAMRASLAAAQIYSMRRKVIARIAFDLRGLTDTQALIFAPDAVQRLMLNMPPEIRVRELAEWLVEQHETDAGEVIRTGRTANSPLTRG